MRKMARKRSSTSFWSGFLTGGIAAAAVLVGEEVFRKQLMPFLQKRQNPVAFLDFPKETQELMQDVSWELEKDDNLLSGRGEFSPSSSPFVYWTAHGKTYHKNPSCGSLKRASEVKKGSVLEATKEISRTPCQLCTLK